MAQTDSPFLSAREAELADYGPWVVATKRVDCEQCGHEIMLGEKVRVSSAGDSVCIECGEE